MITKKTELYKCESDIFINYSNKIFMRKDCGLISLTAGYMLINILLNSCKSFEVRTKPENITFPLSYLRYQSNLEPECIVKHL